MTDDALTTHAAWGAGDPRLLVSRDDDARETFHLTQDETRIGSTPDADIRLPGASPLHATITHDEQDEYVLTMHGEGETSALIDVGEPQILRTGARFTIGEWTLAFGREEYADHGRPFGGRVGGEGSDQPPQPQRPDYSAERSGEHPAEDERGWEVRDA